MNMYRGRGVKAFTRALAVLLFFISSFFVVPLSGSTKNESASNKKPLVYTSFYPIQQLTKEIAGDKVEVRCILPRNQDPHFWEPTPKHLAELSRADYLFINGANMEKWRDQVAAALPDLSMLALADAADLISYKGEAAIGDFQYMTAYNYEAGVYPIEFGHTHSDYMRVAFYKDDDGLAEKDLIKIGREVMEDEGELVRQWETFDVQNKKAYKLQMGHEYGGISYRIPEPGRWILFCDRVSTDNQSYVLQDRDERPLAVEVLREQSTTGVDKITYDPHTWLSIRNVKLYIAELEAKLTELYPTYSRTFRRNASALTERLTTLDFTYRDKFKPLKFREFVVCHYAFAYLARDFDLVQYPLQSLTGMEAPGIKKMREAMDFCKRNRVQTVFYEYGHAPDIARTIAGETGGRALPLMSMEYTSLEQHRSGKNYVDFMEMNLENIYQSLLIANNSLEENKE